MSKTNKHDGILLNAAAFLKKGKFNTPFVILFFERKTTAFILLKKPPHVRLYFNWAQETLCQWTAFLYAAADRF